MVQTDTKASPAAKHMFGASSYCRAVVYGTKVGKDNQYAFQYATPFDEDLQLTVLAVS